MGLAFIIILKDKKSFGKKAANVAISTIACALVGYTGGIVDKAISRKWFAKNSIRVFPRVEVLVYDDDDSDSEKDF